MSRRIHAVLVVLTAALVGCANPYREFYTSSPNVQDARSIPTYDHSILDIRIHSTSDFQSDIRALVQQSYVVIGQTSFNASADYISEANVRDQAVKVGAHVVLISAKHSHTISGAIPLSVPQTSTSYTTGSATANGPYGSATAYGNATTTTYGSQTVMMPYSVARYDAGAVFFAKYKPRLGIVPMPLSDELRKLQQSNQGILADIIIEKSPAFLAGILPGDIVMFANGKPLYAPEDLSSMLADTSTQTVNLDVVRDGKKKKFSIRLTPTPATPPKTT